MCIKQYCRLTRPSQSMLWKTIQFSLKQIVMFGQGTASAEVQAVRLASGNVQGSTAYLNLESGDCHGDDAAVKALLEGGVERVVIGLKHPLPHLQGQAIQVNLGFFMRF